MQYFRIFVVIVLSISLFINFNLLSKLGNLENRVNSISGYQQQITNDVNSQTNNINNAINEMKREQSWISPININIDKAEVLRGKANLNFEWQIKELEKNSEVIFNYKFGDNTEYTSINAVEKKNGLFEASVPIEVKPEPEWAIMVRDSNNLVNTKTERVIEEKKIEENKQSQFSYFISVSHEDMIKSGEINTTHTGHIGTSYYGILEVNTEIHNDNLSVYVMRYSVDNDSPVFLKDIFLKKYKDGQLVDEEKLSPPSNRNEQGTGMPVGEHETTFYTNASQEKFDYTGLVVKAIYSNGTTFEKEIY